MSVRGFLPGTVVGAAIVNIAVCAIAARAPDACDCTHTVHQTFAHRVLALAS
jgi:hypothetical protein